MLYYSQDGDEMKKILCIILSISCFFSIVSCSNKNDSNNVTNNAPEEKIGLITDYETFNNEMSKRIDLSKYIFFSIAYAIEFPTE